MSTIAPSTEIAIHRPGEQRMGFFTDTTVCIGCKACEVACKQWNDLPADGSQSGQGISYDHTGDLSASTWRHVRFVELFEPSAQLREEAQRALGNGRGGHLSAIPAAGAVDLVDAADAAPGLEAVAGRGAQDGRLGVHVGRVQALHQRGLPRRLSDRCTDPHRASDGGAPARRV